MEIPHNESGRASRGNREFQARGSTRNWFRKAKVRSDKAGTKARDECDKATGGGRRKREQNYIANADPGAKFSEERLRATHFLYQEHREGRKKLL